MALRDKLTERAQPYLEPGEQVRQVFMGQTGPNPFLAAISWLIILIAGEYFVFVVTDRAVLVLKASKWVPSKVKGLEARLPRTTPIGPLSGIWGQTHALGKRVWINKRFHKDVAAADAEMGQAPPPAV